MDRAGRRQVVKGLAALAITSTGDFSRAIAGPSDLLEAADRARYPQAALQLTNTLSEYVSGSLRSQIVLDVLAKPNSLGRFNSLVRYIKPTRDAGKAILFQGAELWFYDPNSRATVRISPEQRLIGQASNGDVVLSNFAADYKPLGAPQREVITDADRTARTCLQLDLRQARPGVAYPRVELWLDANNSRPVRARFYAASGRLLKTAFWRAYAPILGQVRATETAIVDAVNPKLATTMKLSGVRLRELPDAWFNRSALADASSR